VKGVRDLRRRDEVDVRVDRPGGEDLPVARDDLGLRADDEIRVDAVHRLGDAGLAKCGDPRRHSIRRQIEISLGR